MPKPAASVVASARPAMPPGPCVAFPPEPPYAFWMRSSRCAADPLTASMIDESAPSPRPEYLSPPLPLRWVASAVVLSVPGVWADTEAVATPPSPPCPPTPLGCFGMPPPTATPRTATTRPVRRRGRGSTAGIMKWSGRDEPRRRELIRTADPAIEHVEPGYSTTIAHGQVGTEIGRDQVRTPSNRHSAKAARLEPTSNDRPRWDQRHLRGESLVPWAGARCRKLTSTLHHARLGSAAQSFRLARSFNALSVQPLVWQGRRSDESFVIRAARGFLLAA